MSEKIISLNLDDFLHRKGIDLPSIVDCVESNLGLGVDDVLLAVGSLVEGLGTIKSDLDLWLITPRPEHLLPPQEEIGLPVGRCLVDVRIFKLSQLEELLTRFESWSSSPWNVTYRTSFTSEELVFLHRLLKGKLLPHHHQRDSVTLPRPAQRDVARLKLHVARHDSRTIQVDMIGYRDSGDYGSLVFAAQELLGHAADALLAGYEVTNPPSKMEVSALRFAPFKLGAFSLSSPNRANT